MLLFFYKNIVHSDADTNKVIFFGVVIFLDGVIFLGGAIFLDGGGSGGGNNFYI